MNPVAELDIIYDEIHAVYAPGDPDLVRRRTVPDVLQSRIVLLGQALGRDTQRLSGLPYCFPPPERTTLSRGGQELDRFLAGFGYTILPGGRGQYAYHTDLAHYFPGRKARGTGDVKPPAEEVARNRRWFESELRLIKPAIVVPLGQQPAAVFLERYAGRRVKRLSEVAGVPFPCTVVGLEVQVIAVPHPSGAFQHPSARETYERAAAHVRRILGTVTPRARVQAIQDI